MAIVTAFASIASQWRTAPLASGAIHYVGLDYSAVRARLGEQLSADAGLWDGIEVMEIAARTALNER